MGRQLRRVALDFDWPLNVAWKGFISPYSAAECYGCKDNKHGAGFSKEADKLAEQWYAFENPRWVYTSKDRRYNDSAMMYHLTQEDVDELVKHDRLWDFTRTWSQDKGWQDKKPAYRPTADEVNEWSKYGMGHDSLNEGIVIQFRCKKMGLPYTCSVCDGSGELWQSPEIEKAADKWESIEPPSGDGWQLWETVSEGSPITPVFATKEKLVDYMVKGDAWSHKWTREQAEAMVAEGWVMSGMAVNGKVMKAEEAVEYSHNQKATKS